MRLRLPIGYDNFGELIEHQFDFVDKTLWIKDLLDNATTKVTLVTRPRRFGKTLNLSMLRYFFASEVIGRPTKGYFDGLNIAKAGDAYMQHQGRYPVIFISFKDVKNNHFEDALAKLGILIAEIYREHHYLFYSPKILDNEKETISRILDKKASKGELETSLKDLSYYLYQHHGVRPWLLIDEYDTPIQSGYAHGYYNEIINVMRGLFSAVLKTNDYLERAVITGILRISKESLFSDLNNLEVFSLLRSEYGQYFGFTEEEVFTLVKQSNLAVEFDNIRQWYNGYQIGEFTVYNPWSIVNCLKQHGKIQPYWINTSGNVLVKQLLARADENFKVQLESLLRNEVITASINENMVFADLDKDNQAIWALLLFSGYLKAIHCERNETLEFNCQLLPPNREVLLLYRSIMREWWTAPLGSISYQQFLASLTQGRIEEFTERLQDCLVQTFSIFDISGQHPERFYHGFVLGMMISLQDTHIIQSNRESGYGRYDVMLIPKDKTQLGIILEFKTVRDANKNLHEAAQDALAQINARHYAEELIHQGITRILKLGLAFHGKSVVVLSD